jgi:hypothetical protein
MEWYGTGAGAIDFVTGILFWAPLCSLQQQHQQQQQQQQRNSDD